MTSFFVDKNPLTPKEQIVLREIGNGLSSKEISEKLSLIYMEQLEIIHLL